MRDGNVRCLLLGAMAVAIAAMWVSDASGDIAGFDDLPLAGESYWNGSDMSEGFTSGGATFNNNFADWGYGYTAWDGFAYSNITDTATPGLAGQYNAITGSGQGGSGNYGVSADPVASGFGTELPTMTLNNAGVIDGIYVTNTNYAYYSMLGGDIFAKKFGGASGDDPDWFLLTITGRDLGGAFVGTEEFWLADYTSANNEEDYIVTTWEYVDLSSLGVVKTLEFALTSSDSVSYDGGVTYYANTPAYFALDTIVPEPATLTVMALGVVLLRRRKMETR